MTERPAPSEPQRTTQDAPPTRRRRPYERQIRTFMAAMSVLALLATGYFLTNGSTGQTPEAESTPLATGTPLDISDAMLRFSGVTPKPSPSTTRVARATSTAVAARSTPGPVCVEIWSGGTAGEAYATVVAELGTPPALIYLARNGGQPAPLGTGTPLPGLVHEGDQICAPATSAPR